MAGTAEGLLGLGLRRGLVESWRQLELGGFGELLRPDFIEITPENWMSLGGRFRRDLAFFAERYPVYAHGLSLSIGGPGDLDIDFIDRLKDFLEGVSVIEFSEHLSYCTGEGHLYDLMPIPFTEAAIARVSERVARVQDRLGRRIALENVSYYAMPSPEMSELEFLCAVLERADCHLLLDVNNVYVNSVNHGYDPFAFIDGLPASRVRYQHIAGHFVQGPSQIIDTHGAAVSDSVWQLLAHTVSVLGPRPTVLERDSHLPPLAVLLEELGQVGRTLTRPAREPASESAEALLGDMAAV